MKQEMLINVSQPEECRIAIVEDGVLEELYIERTSQDNYVGNIYKGRVVNLEPSIQAAFVDFGVGRNGFLHISDVEPQYFRQGGYDPRQANLPDGGGQSRGRDFEQHEGDDDDDRGDDDDLNGPPRGDSRGESRGNGNGNGGRRTATAGPKTSRFRTGVRPRFKPPIQDIFQRGDE